MKKSFLSAALGLALAFIAAVPAQAGNWTNYARNHLVDSIFRGQASGVPATWYIRLNTTTCSTSASGTEVSTTSTGYSRVAVTASFANWAGTQGAGTTVASSGTTGATSNNAAVTFGTPTGDWGQVQSIEFMDASSGGNSWICIALTAAKNVNNGDAAPAFPAGTLTYTIQ